MPRRRLRARTLGLARIDSPFRVAANLGTQGENGCGPEKQNRANDKDENGERNPAG